MLFIKSLTATDSKQKTVQAGFSMVELMVSIGIILLVLTITLTRQSSFNTAVLLQSEAFDVALAIKEAQLSSVSAASDGTGDFRSTVGVHFGYNTAYRNQYIIFRDMNGNGYYNSGADEVFGSPGVIDSRFEVREIIPNPSGQTASVAFQRPNYDAIFHESGSSELVTANLIIQIGIAGASGNTCGEDYREIEITAAGQISVLNCP